MSWNIVRGTLLLTACVLLASGCRQTAVAEAAAALQVVLNENIVAPGDTHATAVWADVREFYRRRDGAPRWITELSTSARTAAALGVLRSAPAHGLIAADYSEPRVAQLLDALDRGETNAPDRLKRLADVDVQITAALLSLGRDVAVGRTSPARLDRNWKARRTAPDLVGTLGLAAEADLSFWLAAIRPQHPEYAALQQALAGLRQRQASGGWPNVPRVKFTIGGSHPAVVTLRRRLAADGCLADAPGASESSVYDADVERGVRVFQEHHGLKETGLADAATLASINVGIADRITQLELNLERWRWMPDDFGARHLLVNIPRYHVLVRENGAVVRDIRVVVGKRGHETPVFSSEMTTVVFSPYWNIPDSIVVGETAPAMAKDPKYLARHNIEILRLTSSGVTPVPPSQVNWSDPQELRQLAFRQKPGPANALGHVKFLFPNPYSVYLHDTPADELFARPGRAFSHGCIRIEEPETLAQYVLRDDPTWPTERMLQAMNSGVETAVTLKQAIPVHIVYFTAYVDANGGLHFPPDIYGYDAQQRGATR